MLLHKVRRIARGLAHNTKQHLTMDYTLAPLLNAAALNSHHGIEQLIQQPPPPFAAAAAPAPASSDDDEIQQQPPPTKKKKARKKSTSTNTTILKTTPLNLNHPDSDTHKLQTNQQLLDTASRIEDAISELESYANLLAADGHKLQHRQHNSRSASAHHIRESIVPLLQITANTLREAGKCFAPFHGTGRLHERNDIERKRKLMEAEAQNNNNQAAKKSSALIMIDDFVERSNWSPPPVNNTAAKSNSSSKKRKASTSSTPTNHILTMTLLQPRNGSTYTKSEAIAIAKQYKKGETGRRQIINAMVEKGFIPVHRRSLDRLMKKMENGEILLDDPWHLSVGRPNKLWPEHMKPQPIDGNLTFEDLDTGDNRIVVEYDINKNKRQKTEEEADGVEEVEDDKSVDGDDRKPSPKKYARPSKKKWDINPNVIAFEIPPPRDGSKLYKTTEFVEIIKPFIATNDHHVAIRAAMYQGYVGAATKRSLVALVKKAEKGDQIFDSEWTPGRRGRPPAVSTDEVDTIVERIKEEDLRIYDNSDVNRLMVEALMKKGVVDQAKLAVCNRTVAHYFTLLKSKLSPLYWKKPSEEDDDDDDE